jgi:glycosyltransferase involved in cell wall biosynthesis
VNRQWQDVKGTNGKREFEMKVIMKIRPDTEKYPGGDFIQLLKTREYLHNYGIDADISHFHKIDLKGYDIVHLFNVTRITDTYLFFHNARNQGRKTVLSPIYHPLKDMQDFYRYYYKLPFLPIIGYLSLKEIFYPLRAGAPLSFKCILAYKNAVKEVISKSDLLLPNSHMEYKCIEKELKVKNQFRIIPNAAELSIDDRSQENKEDMIVCAGRIEPRKNQNRVIEAFIKGYSKFPPCTKLIFIGSLNQSHKSYCKAFLEKIDLERDRIEYLGVQPHDRVIDYLSRARLSVLSSFFETTGLVGLEALACKANIVITDRGYTKEYFGTHALYCDPYCVESIADALVKGFYRPIKQKEVRDLIKKYSWKKAAALTAQAYREVLASR